MSVEPESRGKIFEDADIGGFSVCNPVVEMSRRRDLPGCSHRSVRSSFI